MGAPIPSLSSAAIIDGAPLSTDAHMPVSFILVMAAVAAYLATCITALLVHGIWVAPFIERHGKRTTGFLVLWALGPLALIRDYLKARRLCQARGIRPRWMGWFASLLLGAGILVVALVAFMLWSFAAR